MVCQACAAEKKQCEPRAIWGVPAGEASRRGSATLIIPPPSADFRQLDPTERV